MNIGPYKETRIRAYGPGLKGGVVGYPALFTVETNGEAGGLGECQAGGLGKWHVLCLLLLLSMSS